MVSTSIVYNWFFGEKVYNFNPRDHSELSAINTPAKYYTILNRLKRKKHPLFQRLYPDLQGSPLQWFEKTRKQYLDDQEYSEIISSFSNVLNKIVRQNNITQDKEIAQFIISFCQNIPYKGDKVPYGYLTDFDEYPKYPLETLLDNEGDCEDKAMLAVALLRELGFKTALVVFSGHMGIGLEIPNITSSWEYSYFRYGDRKYIYAEVSSNGWQIGELPGQLKNKAALVFPCN